MANEKSWEHHVTNIKEDFDYSNLNLDLKEKLEIDKNSKIPSIVIFGWAGASDKYLKVYSKFYEERGIPSIRYIVPLRYLFFRSNEMLRIGEEMAEVFTRQKFKDSPVIYHILSNGGAFEYEVFMRALKNTPHQNQVKGTIFDSCPAKRNPMKLYLAIKANVPSKHFKTPIAASLTGYSILKRSLEMNYARMLGKECVQMNPYGNLMNEKCRWPQHFIYSTLDNVVPLKCVESFADHRRRLGVDVTFKCYDNSQHVQHYLKNKSSYIRSVFKFLNKCLKRYMWCFFPGFLPSFALENLLLK